MTAHPCSTCGCPSAIRIHGNASGIFCPRCTDFPESLVRERLVLCDGQWVTPPSETPAEPAEPTDSWDPLPDICPVCGWLRYWSNVDQRLRCEQCDDGRKRPLVGAGFPARPTPTPPESLLRRSKVWGER
jgi:hypothetical protein